MVFAIAVYEVEQMYKSNSAKYEKDRPSFSHTGKIMRGDIILTALSCLNYMLNKKTVENNVGFSTV
jgi:hypothetical protein